MLSLSGVLENTYERVQLFLKLQAVSEKSRILPIVENSYFVKHVSALTFMRIKSRMHEGNRLPTEIPLGYSKQSHKTITENM